MKSRLKSFLEGFNNFIKFKRYNYFEKKNNLSNFLSKKKNSENYKQIIKDLKRNGYYVIKNYLSVDKCKEIRLIIDNFIEMYPKNIWVDENKSDHRIMGAENISKVIESLDLNLFTKEIGSQYLSQELELFMIMANKTIFKNDNLGSGGGWHKDSHSNQFKSILYLNDVNEENGPFEIIKSSNKDLTNLKLFTKLKKKFPDTRYSSDDINNITDTNKTNIIKITGEAGNLLLVNTSLIHRGSPLKSGCRYAMTNYFYSKNKLQNYKNHFPKRIIEKFY